MFTELSNYLDSDGSFYDLLIFTFYNNCKVYKEFEKYIMTNFDVIGIKYMDKTIWLSWQDDFIMLYQVRQLGYNLQL